MKNNASSFIGSWRITAMEVWDTDYLDMEVPAFITIAKDLTGEFQFGMVQGQLDGRIVKIENQPRFDFSWSGFDENDPVSGHGWFVADGNLAEGRFFIHQADDSGFHAERQ